MGHLHFGDLVVPAVQLAVTKPSSRDTTERFTRVFSRLYLNHAENQENSEIWLGRFPSHLFILPPLLCGERFRWWGANVNGWCCASPSASWIREIGLAFVTCYVVLVGELKIA